MSSPDRIYEPAREPVEEGFNTPPKPKKRKRWGLEQRYIGPDGIYSRFIGREWHSYRKYATEKDRDKALESLGNKRHHDWAPRYEYRKAEDGDSEVRD
jgi:hypothetical protein